MASLDSIVYEETCMCGGSIRITTEIRGEADRASLISHFQYKHRSCDQTNKEVTNGGMGKS